MDKKINILPITEWGLPDNKKPLIIAGPCSAESEEQIMSTARELKANGISIFRAGVWKPRTRPNHFEGMGVDALKWLRQVKQETGMLTSTEVANTKHVFEALKFGVDILWLGARTSANPFAVQEIADALSGVDIPILIKNPVNPDLELWIGAVERIAKAGITRIGAIHRGFSSYSGEEFRNPPMWQIPIELKRRLPEIPIICDPSHMGGKRELLKGISQKAIDLAFEGLMIEAHIDPDNAMSDAKQQLTPLALKNLLAELIIREPGSKNASFHMKLEELRSKIDQMDNELINLLGSRMEVAELIGYYKKENNVTILQGIRWDKIVKSRVDSGMEIGLSSEFLMKVLKAIHEESINHQTDVMNGKEIKGLFDHSSM